MADTYEQQRQEFAQWLVDLRLTAGFRMAKDFAERLGWPKTRLSKVETGKQLPDENDLAAWLNAVDAPADVAADAHRRLELVRQAQARWQRQLRSGHARRQERDAQEESEATVIRAVDLLLVPGLLQTPPCIRQILSTQAELLGIPVDDIEAAVKARVARQQVLYDDTKHIEILTTEAALTMGLGGVQQKIGQIDRLLSAVELLGPRFGIVPLDAELPNIVLHGWWIVDDEVVVELGHTESRTRAAGDLAYYRTLTDRLWSVAATGDAARELLRQAAARLRGNA